MADNDSPVEGTNAAVKKKIPKKQILKTIKQETSEKNLIEDLFCGNDDESRAHPKKATPEGYSYVAHRTHSQPLSGLILALSPHPSDASSDFYSHFISRTVKLGARFQQLIITRGEKGVEGGNDDETIRIRYEEEKKASKTMKINADDVKYLTTRSILPEEKYDFYNGEYHFPDGKLLQNLPLLTDRIADYIRAAKPRALLLPALLPDHPDHLATAIAGINAVLKLQREENFFGQHGKIEIFTCDPEFAVAIGQPWAVKEIDNLLKQKIITKDDLKWHYRYHVDQDGLVTAADLTKPQEPETQELADYPIAVAPFIATVTEAMESRKMSALLAHKTQTDGKNYAHLIPKVDRLRASEIDPKKKWAMALYPVYIPDITTSENSLIDALPAGSVFQLKKECGVSR